MPIIKFFASKDNTITDAFLPGLRNRATSSNQGASDIFEVHSIYAQSTTSSIEKTRALVQFPVDKILASRNSEKIPASGSVDFVLRFFNAAHNSTTPESFTISITPVLQPWTEGIGLDMETYSDIGASSWLSCSATTPWSSEGGTDSVAVSDNLNSGLEPHIYNYSFDTGLEDFTLDISELTELWLQNESGGSVAASASLTLTSVPATGEKFKIFATTGESLEVIFSTSSLTTGNISYVERVAGNITNTRNNVVTSIQASPLFSSANLDSDKLTITQTNKGFYGNTAISSSAGIPITITNFNGGAGVINNGILVKLSGSAEDGSLEKSYYTKKFFARNSEFFFKKPTIEARSENVIADDRGTIFKSSSLAPASDNLNKIYLYNVFNGAYADIPNTGSNLLVKFVSDVGQSPVTMSAGDLDSTKTFVTASRHSKGVYEAQFAYDGSESKLREVWTADTRLAQGTFTYTGTVADLNNGVNFTLVDTAGISHVYTFDTSGDTHTVSGQNSTIGVQTAKGGSDTTAIASQVNAAINASSFFDSSVNSNQVTIKQKLPGTNGNRASAQSAGNVGYTVTNLAIPNSAPYTELVTGSYFDINTFPSYDINNMSKYVFKITNLKSNYTQDENVKLRLHTKKKNNNLNIYTVATNQSQVENVKNVFYKISRTADNLCVVNYSTGSGTKYTKLSYDMSGSYFELDMSILEPNYQYEISFLRQEGINFFEQDEKFRFRVKEYEQ